MIPQNNQFLPATWNVRMDVQDQKQISAMSVNTSEEVPAMYEYISTKWISFYLTPLRKLLNESDYT